MTFSPANPTLTDPSLDYIYPNDYAWGVSREENTYYSWIQKITPETCLSSAPLEIDLGCDVKFQVYQNTSGIEFLYRLRFLAGMPKRIRVFPEPYCLFWSYGDNGKESGVVKYHYKDRFLTIHEWVDRKSYLAVLRQQIYLHQESSNFWSRL